MAEPVSARPSRVKMSEQFPYDNRLRPRRPRNRSFISNRDCDLFKHRHNFYYKLCELEIKSETFLPQRSRDSVVGIATGYGLEVRVPVGSRIFPTSSRPALGPIQPPIQWVPRALSPGVKRQGREAHHSYQTSAEVKNILIYTSTPPYAFMA
jgi:hypothetical protein